MEFSKKLKELRTKKGLTQREMSVLLNISNSTIGMYETNKREPDNATLSRIADFFDVSTDYLLGRVDEPKGEKRIQTIAAHRTDDPMADLPPEAIERIEEFKDMIRQKYGRKKPNT
jgi:transcriptional regulator with XRE-family HTH domain